MIFTFVLGVITGIYIAQNYNILVIKPYIERFYNIIIQVEDKVLNDELTDENNETQLERNNDADDEVDDDADDDANNDKEIDLLETRKTGFSFMKRCKDYLHL
uniref:Uncharacterized protein n=1 Tax=viral metagenome TaxID=1070528 RepID=A0A6C0KEN0_9ZZZZ